MKKIFKIIISGPRCSGKTSLLHLLDGDQNLVNYNHDKFLNLYGKLFNYADKDEYQADLKKKKVLLSNQDHQIKKNLNIHILKKNFMKLDIVG